MPGIQISGSYDGPVYHSCNVKHCFFSMLNLGYREMSNCFLTHAVGCPQGDKLVDLKKTLPTLHVLLKK